MGAAIGAKNRANLRRAAWISAQWGLGCAVLLAAGFALGGPYLIDLMATSPEVRQEARDYLIWAAALPIISLASYMYDGIYIGATWTRDMRIAMIQSVAIYVLTLVALVPLLGNHGLWVALVVLNVARGVTLGLRYPGLEARVAR